MTSCRRVVVPGSGSITQNFQIQLSGVRETVTVTATGTEESVSQSIQSVTVLSQSNSHKRIQSVSAKHSITSLVSLNVPSGRRRHVRSFAASTVIAFWSLKTVCASARSDLNPVITQNLSICFQSIASKW